MIELEDVSYTYAYQSEAALSRVNLRVAAGELKVLTGPSGCGKTTVMRVVNGLIPHLLGGTLTGRVAVAGEEPQHTSLVALSSVVGTLFQDPEEQFFALNVHDEIAFTLKSRGVAAEEIEARVAEAAARLGIESILERDIHALSEGQKQKVGLASLLVLRPKVLVLDEPSANLDPEATEELAELLLALKQLGTAILVVDHRLYWLKDVADEVLVMRAGQIVARGDWAMLTESFCVEHGLRAPVVGDVRETLASVPVWHGSEVARIAPANARFGAQNLSFGYSAEEPLFHEVSFSVPAGITALIGANGEGKTTLARVLTGLNKAQGQFIVGTAVSDAAGLLARAGLVLQNADHQLQMRTVREEIATAHAVGRTLKEAQKRFPRVCEEDWAAAEQWMAALNLAGLGERHPQSLSGGQKQRVVIACALAKSPDILILDEPTSGLDGANMHDIAAVLRSAADRGVAVFLITHDLELLTICDAALRIRELRSSFTNDKEREHD